jgi:hypothetical protein
MARQLAEKLPLSIAGLASKPVPPFAPTDVCGEDPCADPPP